jgi:uncharacterized membrane protein YhaH (DUF805 family)
VDWLRLFTSFSGRIGRIYFLIGIAVVLLLSPFALAVLFAKTGIMTMLGKLGIAGMVWWLVLLWPVTALAVKRFRDRQRPSLLALVFTVPAIFVVVATYSSWHDMTMAYVGLINVALVAIGCWFLIELGAYPGRLPGVSQFAAVGKGKAPGKVAAKKKARRA